MNYILLVGIHGVGKSTLLNKIKTAIPLEFYTISSLIKKANANNKNNTDKRTSQISKNQELWKAELKNIRSTSEITILDGHFSLLNSQGEIVALPLNTFDGVNIIGIILKKEKPAIIQSRLLKRDNYSWEIDKIEDFQSIEEKTAMEYSLFTRTPLFIYDDDTHYDQLLQFIQERLNS